ncbi:MAG: VOC family protein [Candidatus Sericytochromatia bacterium]|nr:VOC family protein [Candidatus Sericytochromatia bacterium]
MHLVRITLAATDLQAMKTFYDRVFQAGFEVQQTPAGAFYHGQIAGLALTLVPNTIAQVRAEQNRQQLSFLVPDLDAALSKAELAGGERHGEVLEGPQGKQAAILDPDGNTIEFLQQVS